MDELCQLQLDGRAGPIPRATVEDGTAGSAADLDQTRLHAMLEAVSDGFYAFDRDWRFTTVNGAALRYFGRPREEIVGQTLLDAFPQAKGSIAAQLYQQVADTGETLVVDIPSVARPDRMLEMTIVSLPEGGVAAAFTDITERRVNERALRDSEARFRVITDAMPQIVWSTLPDGYHDYYNQRWYEFTGVPAGSTDGEGWNDVFHPEDQPLAWERWRHSLATGAAYEIEYRLRHHSGGYRWVLGRALPVRNEAGEITRWMGTCTDIHDQVLARETLERSAEELERQVQHRTDELLQLQKLESIGQLTGGIAHDFNNLLTPILGTLDLLRRRSPDPAAARLINGALQSAEKARNLVSRLLTFARRQTLRAEVVKLPQLVEGMTELVRHSIGRHIEVVVEPPQGTCACRVDPNQLELAFLNLCVNARDAMPDGGRLVIAVEETAVAAGERPPLTPGRYVCLSVTDTGAGMDAETLTRAVEPFFSTKGVGKGTGLGLSMIHGLAAQSDGSLFLFSTPGQGTRAEIWLPRADEVQEPQTPAVAPDLAPERSLSLLLVDDEELVRNGTADMLRSLGHDVHACATAAEALEHLRGDGSTDVLVTDYLMPDVNGAELAREAAKLRPDLPVLLITGYGGSAPEVEHLARLSKPFRAAEVNTALAMLTRSAARA